MTVNIQTELVNNVNDSPIGIVSITHYCHHGHYKVYIGTAC